MDHSFYKAPINCEFIWNKTLSINDNTDGKPYSVTAAAAALHLLESLTYAINVLKSEGRG